MSKVVDLEAAIGLIKDGDSLIGDGITFGVAEDLLVALEERFLKTGHPRNLTVITPGGAGDVRGRGFDHFAHEGFVKKVTASYFNLTRKLSKLVLEEKIEAYMLPLGVYCHLLREIAAGRPGLITTTGLKAFPDPRYEGGRLNSISTSDDFVPEVITFKGKEYLFYKPFNIDVAFLRGTTSDEKGNITLEKEAGILSGLAMAMATKRCGGKVIVQVERIAANGTLNPKEVKIPGILVDAVVVSRPENHMQTWWYQYNPALSGEIRSPQKKAPPVPFDYRKVIARRGLLELKPGMLVNLGAGLPEFISSVAWEEDIYNKITFIIEAGMIGGVPGFGLSFNTATNADCIIDVPSILDFFDGGGHDITLVGFAQFDQYGNINVTKLEGKITGVGGFLNVAPNAKQRVHLGAFTAGKTDIRIENGKVNIVKDGEVLKFINKVEQISVSGEYALEVGQPVKIITERAVFEWTKEGLILVEIAPGINLQKDILAKMTFQAVIPDQIKEMPAEIFREEPLNLSKRVPWTD